MAYFEGKYSPSPGRAKGNVRYIQHRPGKDGKHETRQLFDHTGAPISRDTAYEMIDNAEKKSMFWRFTISPDAKTEDTHRDLDMRALAQNTIAEIEEKLNKPIPWIAAVHTETDNRHIHILAIVNGFIPPSTLQAMRHTATREALQQRQQLDLTREHEQQHQKRKEQQWEREQSR